LHMSSPELMNKTNSENINVGLTIALKAPNDLNKYTFATMVLAKHLGGGRGSLLFKELSENKGLTYSIGSSYTSSTGHGIINIQTSVQTNKQEEAIDSIFSQIAATKSKKCETHELNRIKKKLLFEVSREMETNNGQMREIQMYFDMNETLESYLDKINAVTSKDVLEVANKYLPEKNGNYVLLIKDSLKKE
jgi:zinc protease